MPKFLDMTGWKFGRLTVIKCLGLQQTSTRPKNVWLCVCECGADAQILGESLRSGATKSCGCLRAELTSKRLKTHGHSRSSQTYKSWASMIQRCSNPKKKEYGCYGGRGIDVCKRWLVFANFLADMGERPKGLTLDRIDNDLGYGPLNCRWANHIEQSRNRRTNRPLTLDGETLLLSDWAQRIGINISTLSERLDKWPLREALTRPSRYTAKLPGAA
jgi:hypothetical protein